MIYKQKYMKREKGVGRISKNRERKYEVLQKRNEEEGEENEYTYGAYVPGPASPPVPS